MKILKWIIDILAILFILAGTMFILQGTGVYPVGMMANNMKYTYIGIVIDVVAIAVLFLINRRPRNLPPPQSQ